MHAAWRAPGVTKVDNPNKDRGVAILGGGHFDGHQSGTTVTI
jgi:hypothetical protein